MVQKLEGPTCDQTTFKTVVDGNTIYTNTLNLIKLCYVLIIITYPSLENTVEYPSS